MARIIVLIVSLLSSVYAFADGFKSGDKFEAINLFGSVVVRCNDPMRGNGMRFESCAGYFLNPSEYDYFVSSNNVQAKNVRLTAMHEDGGSQTKTVAFDQAKRQSKKQINLWISSITQTPLLAMGKNTVSVEYLNSDKQVTATSQFMATVEDGGNRSCQARTYFSNNILDCQNAALICSRYFSDENYCEY